MGRDNHTLTDAIRRRIRGIGINANLPMEIVVLTDAQSISCVTVNADLSGRLGALSAVIPCILIETLDVVGNRGGGAAGSVLKSQFVAIIAIANAAAF